MNQRLAHTLGGYLEKSADIADAASEGVRWGFDKATAVAMVAPALVGLVSGALVSKVTSPSAKKDEVQKSLIAAELEESLAEMKRKQAIANAKEMSNVGSLPRSLHM